MCLFVCACACSQLTSAELLAPVLQHCGLCGNQVLPFQNVLVVLVADGPLLTPAAMLRPAAVANTFLNLGEDGGFVEQSQVSLKVKVRVQVLFCCVSKALVVLGPHCSSRASVPYAAFLHCGLCRPCAMR